MSFYRGTVKRAGSSVSQSRALCNALLVRLRSLFPRALAADLFLRARIERGLDVLPPRCSLLLVRIAILAVSVGSALVLVTLGFGSVGSATTPGTEVLRISSMRKNMGEVEKIYLTEGLVSVVEFPEEILDLKSGNGKNFKFQISEKNTKELIIYQNQFRVGLFTNLIVRTNGGVYIFDLINNKKTHQDYLKIEGVYSRPHSQRRALDAKSQTNEFKNKKLIFKSEI